VRIDLRGQLGGHTGGGVAGGGCQRERGARHRNRGPR
jgi:hypothetical protein